MLNTIGRFFGIAVFTTGVVNIFWGNDPEFGAFILILSIAYFPEMKDLIEKYAGFSIHPAAKVIAGIFIIWQVWELES